MYEWRAFVYFSPIDNKLPLSRNRYNYGFVSSKREHLPKPCVSLSELLPSTTLLDSGKNRMTKHKAIFPIVCS